MKKCNYLPAPVEIYLALKKIFDSKDEVKEPVSKSEKLEKLYSQWKTNGIKLEEKIPIQKPKRMLFRILFIILTVSAAVVLINTINPFLTKNISDLIVDNLSRLTFLSLIISGFSVGNNIYVNAQDEYVLSPKRMFFAFELENKIKNQKKVSKINSVLSAITVISLFVLGYVWTMIMALAIAIFIVATYTVSIKRLKEETKKAFENI